MTQREEFMKKRMKARKRMQAIQKTKGIVYQVDDNSVTVWKDGKLYANMKFRFGSKYADKLLKGKKLKKVT
jgi:hypothetical protein